MQNLDNAELRRAIEETIVFIKTCSPVAERYERLHQHLDELLKAQSERARPTPPKEE